MKIRTRFPGDPTGELLGHKHWPCPESYYFPPERFVALNRRTMKLLGTGEQGTLWNTFKSVPMEDLVFGSIDGFYKERLFEVFTKEQWFTIVKNTFDKEVTDMDSVKNLLKRVRPLQVNTASLLYDVNNPPTPMEKSVVNNPKSFVVGVKSRVTGSKVLTPTKQPLNTTKTGKVWVVADEVAQQYPAMSPKQWKSEVVSRCVKIGLNSSTAQVQFGKWLASK